MREEIIYQIKSIYRDEMRVTGFHFGEGEKAVCIVGAMRGNEIEQLYTCTQLMQELKKLEEKGCIVEGKEILVIPSVNNYSINVSKRFWPNDNTDINRMFPGYNLGETTQRIAAGVFEKIQNYEFGIQFASFYLPGRYIPHVRVMNTGYQDMELAKEFGLPYAILRNPKPYDTTTLNYNWQIWNTKAFSVYNSETDEIDEQSASMAIAAVLRFLDKNGIIRYKAHKGYVTSLIHEENMCTVKSNSAGIFRSYVKPYGKVEQGEQLAEVIDPLRGDILETIAAPCDGVIFFAHKSPLVMAHTAVYKLIIAEEE
ncbi:MAG: M14 family metallopeptidase [Lachnospiraceae bacterium]